MCAAELCCLLPHPSQLAQQPGMTTYGMTSSARVAADRRIGEGFAFTNFSYMTYGAVISLTAILDLTC
jgi:hypothetical protein